MTYVVNDSLIIAGSRIWNNTSKSPAFPTRYATAVRELTMSLNDFASGSIFASVNSG